MDSVNHPPHYTSHPSGVECLTITRHMNFNLGNAFKYLWRAGLKGKEVEDLKKAVFYVLDEIARIEGFNANTGGEGQGESKDLAQAARSVLALPSAERHGEARAGLHARTGKRKTVRNRNKGPR
jgi:hypothetical protein